MRATISAAAAILSAGCATTTGLGPTSKVSGFDGGRVVDIQPHSNACDSMRCTGLGAQWTSARPNDAILTVRSYNSIVAILGAKLSIDGRVVELVPTQATTTFDTSVPGLRMSTRAFAAPLSVVREITSANKAWLRVNTPDGYVEDAIIDGPKDSKALHALKRFLASVDSPG